MPARFSPSRPCPLSAVPRWDFEADVIVVGFGAAGASAAIEAAEAGAKVRLFEVASGSGGTSALSGGDIYLGGGGGTPPQRAAGFEDQTEDMVRYMLMAGGPDADEPRVRLYVDNALAHFEWLKRPGLAYRNSYLPGKRLAPATGDCLIWSGSEAAWPFSAQAKPAPRGHLPVIADLGGRRIVDTLATPARHLGVEAI
jgi:3-oxo-5alpha-steroid 4-dehydrogenase